MVDGSTGSRSRCFGARDRATSMRRATVCALVLAVAGTESGCVSYRAVPLDPEAELRLLQQPVDLGGLELRPRAEDAARGPFDAADGLDEAELVAVALTLNPDLRARRARIGETEALLVAAGALPNPDLDGFLRHGIGGAPATGFGIDLLFTVLGPDVRAAKREIADAKLAAARAEIASGEARLAADVRRSRIAVLSAAQAVRELEVEAALRDEALRLVQQQRALGEATELSLLVVDLDRSTQQRELREARQAHARERSTLVRMLGLPPNFLLVLTGESEPLEVADRADPTDAELDRRLLEARTDLQVLADAYQAAEGELRLACARQFPLLRIGPSFERDVEGSQGLGMAGSVELPLFDRNQGEIAEKLAARDRARVEYVARLHELRATAFAAREALRAAREEVARERAETLPLVERTEALFEAAFRAREMTVFEWLAARGRAVQARSDLSRAIARYALAAVELDVVLGTGAGTGNVSTDEEQGGR